MEKMASHKCLKSIRLLTYGSNWSEHLANLIASSEDCLIYARHICISDINPIKLVWAVFRADMVMRVGVRPGRAGKRFVALDLLWLIFQLIWPRKIYLYYWIGTDVLHALEDKAKNQSSFFFNASRKFHHFANAPWLKDELASIGINADVVLFPTGMVNPPSTSEIEWPSRFCVLAYIPDHRHQFYGGEEYVTVARRVPDVEFLIVGGVGDWIKDKPDNVKFLGRREDMIGVYNSAHVVVRQVRHDAIGGSVREGLFFARYVIYSYPLPHTYQVAWGDADELLNKLSELRRRFINGQLMPNNAGREYALSAWDPEKMLAVFCRKLYSLLWQ